MKKGFYWLSGLVILFLVFVIVLFCKNKNLDSTSYGVEKPGFIVEDVLDQVVHIQSKKTVNYIFESSESKKYESILGDGSGIFVRKDGLILTNRHVVSDPDLRYEVVFLDGSVYVVDKIWYHDSLDLALIRIQTRDGGDIENQHGVRNISKFIDDLNTIYIGDEVFAVGTLFGKYQNAVSAGIVSKKNVSFVYEGVAYTNLLLSDVLVSPGNSGGPLFNTNGEVIAIVTAQNGLGGTYAIPFSDQNLQDFINSIGIN